MMRHAILVAILSFHLLPCSAAFAEQKLYVLNEASGDVSVVDVATHKVIGRIPVGPKPHGIAVPRSGEVVFVSVEGNATSPGELLWIDPSKDKVIKRLKTGPTPNEIEVTPDGKFIYVPCRDGYWHVIDLETTRTVKKIFVGGKPHNTVISADGKRMYLGPIGAPKKVIIVDTTKHEKIGEIPLSASVRPIAVRKDEKRLYANVDGLVGIEVADIPSRKRIHRVPAKLSPKQRKVASRSHGLAIRPDQKEIWSCDVNHDEVQVFDITTDPPKQTHAIPTGGMILWITFNPNGRTAYVSVSGKNEVIAIDAVTKKVTHRIAVGKLPKRLLVVDVPDRK